ncbi:hypothetical protein CW304_32905 [Bacillus sp. UFRGS-B20]|nr:hypothetical protein CW304_32905 [Bacillus sp. UFRGS-B20]
MIAVLLELSAKRGRTTVRLDAVGYMWKTPGTCRIHLEENSSGWLNWICAPCDEVAPGTFDPDETNVPPTKITLATFGSARMLKRQMVLPVLRCRRLVLHAHPFTGQFTRPEAVAASLDANSG